MVGLGAWKFPVEFTAIEGDDVIVKWTQIIPGTRADGTPYTQSAVLATALRRRREVLLRGGHLQHGPRPGGRGGERLGTE